MALVPQPILLLASERSGSNLLRIMLDNHSEISGPAAPHLFKTLAPLLSRYGDLADPVAASELASHCLLLCRTHFGPWDLTIEPDELVETAPRHTLAGIVFATYAAMAHQEGKSFWICKENDLWRYASALVACSSAPRVIYLYRDGRDVASSLRRSNRVRKSWAQLAAQWSREQRECQHALDRVRAISRCAQLSYEDLTTDPTGTLKRLCRDLDICYEDALAHPESSTRAHGDAGRIGMWANLDRPVMQSNAGRWRSELTGREIRLFDRIAGPTLQALGYEPASWRHTTGSPSSLELLLDLALGLPRALRVTLRQDDPARQPRDAAIREIQAELPPPHDAPKRLVDHARSLRQITGRR